MKREIFFRGVEFKPETIKEAASLLIGLVPGDERTDRPDLGLHASLANDKWTHDDQDEFFADYRREDCHDASFHLMPSKLGSNSNSTSPASRAPMWCVVSVRRPAWAFCRLTIRPWPSSLTFSGWCPDSRDAVFCSRG